MTVLKDPGKTIAAFDFDVTITTRDTFFPFLIYAFGWKKTYIAFFKLAIPGILVYLRLYSRDLFKEKIIEALFAGQGRDELYEFGCSYADFIYKLVRPKALDRIRWHKQQGHRLIMVSASLDLYLRPVAKKLGFDDLLCTEVDTEQKKFTGKIRGENCRAQGKVNKLKVLLGDLSEFEIYAYGDSAGDKEMLGIATHSFYRYFT